MKSIAAQRQSRKRSRRTQEDAIRWLHTAPKEFDTERQREEFLALLSHELLTPLTCILGWSQLAHDNADPQTIRTALDVIERNARRQRKLVDELLHIMRMKHGRLVLNPKQIGLWKQLEYLQDTVPHDEVDNERQLTLVLEHPEVGNV